MNNLECVLAVLTAHREARAWSDSAVASDLLAQLGLDPNADAKNPKPAVDDHAEAEVSQAEAEAKAAADRAAELRAKLDAKTTSRPNMTRDILGDQQGPRTPAPEKVVLPPSSAAPSPLQATSGKPVGPAPEWVPPPPAAA